MKRFDLVVNVRHMAVVAGQGALQDARVDLAHRGVGAVAVELIGEHVDPVAHRPGRHMLVDVHVECPGGRVVWRVRAVEAHEEEERFPRVSPS